MNMARGPQHKHFDFERKNAKQAEVRLAHRLQKLEEVCLYHTKLVSREQRQLQKDLQRLQQGKLQRWGPVRQRQSRAARKQVLPSSAWLSVLFCPSVPFHSSWSSPFRSLG